MNWKQAYPIGKTFEAPVWHRGDDQNWEEVEVVNHWHNNIEREHGVMVRTHDGIEFEIDINYLNEDGSGFTISGARKPTCFNRWMNCSHLSAI